MTISCGNVSMLEVVLSLCNFWAYLRGSAHCLIPVEHRATVSLCPRLEIETLDAFDASSISNKQESLLCQLRSGLFGMCRDVI